MSSSNQISNTYLIDFIGSDDVSSSNNIVGLFHGSYQFISQLPTFQASSIPYKVQNIRMIPFSHYSEVDELAEFRLLNHKYRVIVRSVENSSSIVFGYEPDRKKYLRFNINGMLVFRGPIAIHQKNLEQQFNHNMPLTLNIIGHSMVDLNNQLVRMYLLPGEENRFVVDPRTIPYRFQQKTIVQRQRSMLQPNANTSLMSLETLEHLLY